ncbi:NAD(P)-binding protein [Massarina eburnea CBS 473.64]|uniref:NAD(P)-binding protein n=1 Tax=Massarina eburnea CBS 473.64 TaxID=1395130 RepID=A0A6A6RSZ5_9PLEO|nr:NAD(P)-binding protein [Massarina eburnea CBS 473.64]
MPSKRSGPLAPGVAFITGGARGLGNAIAVSFAKEGARGVVIVDIQDEETFELGKKNVQDFGCECIAIRADVTKEDDISNAVQQAVEHFGRIDYAANFAGVVGPSGPISEVSLTDWQKCQDVNSSGVFLATKHEMRQMMTQSGIGGVEDGRVAQRGSIVNCASVNSQMAMTGTTAYTASKHACLGITKAAALEGRKFGVRVNCVSPGFLLTRMLEPIVKGDMGGAITGGVNEEVKKKGAGEVLWEGFEKRQGRKAVFEEVGDVVVLLSTPRMSLVVGANLCVDGGFVINEGND